MVSSFIAGTMKKYRVRLLRRVLWPFSAQRKAEREALLLTVCSYFPRRVSI